ncbi:hypothetical protein [Paraburkholderia saeva]|uniref:hypothetical protein n=1 Tax=Paraburkholderia saeva TaxID=2777537 RepID=UPI001D916FE0|nr:hypothetical protein [Paraburkholderia saeva]CAG4902183.1 hypothetical protein R52603_02940 [Paraburkholderia saeva]
MRDSLFVASPHRNRLASLLGGLLLLVWLVLVVRYQYNLLNYLQYPDESETIVTAKMMAAGGTLYRDIFNHHGPLTFLPGLIIEKFGSFGVPVHRVPVALLQLVALATIFFSPLLKDNLTRGLYTTVCSVILLRLLPGFFYAHAYMYQAIAGLLIIMILAQYTLPAICMKEALTYRPVAVANLLIASLPFLNITFAPTAALLFFASLRRPFLRRSWLWLAIGAALNIAFLGWVGSFRGYAAFHFYMNFEVLPAYNYAVDSMHLFTNIFKVAINPRSWFLVAIAIVSMVWIARQERGFPWRTALLAGALLVILTRGPSFYSTPFVDGALALPLVFFTRPLRRNRLVDVSAVAMFAVCLFSISLILPMDRKRLDAGNVPLTTEFSQLADIFTSPGDKIIVYTVRNYEYVVADRLPASGNFFYFPWQEKYNEHPKLGVKIDTCDEIRKSRPKLMLIDKWTVWDLYSWASYGGCVQDIIDADYTRILNGPYYVRKDILPRDTGIYFPHGEYRLTNSEVLEKGNEIPLRISSGSRFERATLKKIGILFNVVDGQSGGIAELRLKDSDGREHIQRFSISDVANRQYRYFDLDPAVYTSGEIVSLGGSGVSTWEAHAKQGASGTCVVYEYAWEQRKFAPGCPIL